MKTYISGSPQSHSPAVTGTEKLYLQQQS